MNRQLLLAFTFLAYSSINAQITITQDNIIDAGMIIEHAEDINPTITIGGSGANQTWDYSSLQEDTVVTNQFGEAGWYDGYEEFPDANIAAVNGNTVFLRKNATGFDFLGVYDDLFGTGDTIAIHINPYDRFIEFPATYNSEFDNEFFVESVSPGDDPVDSVRYKTMTEQSNTFDAWGELTTPLGTFDVIRQFITETVIDSVWNYTDGNATLDATGESTLYIYRYWSDDPNAQYPLVEFEYDMESEQAYFASWLKSTPTVSVKKNSKSPYKLFPNPASDMIQVSGVSENAQVTIFDITGKLIHTEMLNTSMSSVRVNHLSNGMYIMKIEAESGKQHSEKIVINR